MVLDIEFWPNYQGVMALDLLYTVEFLLIYQGVMDLWYSSFFYFCKKVNEYNLCIRVEVSNISRGDRVPCSANDTLYK